MHRWLVILVGGLPLTFSAPFVAASNTSPRPFGSGLR